MVLQVLVTAAVGIWLSGSGHPSFRRHRDAPDRHRGDRAGGVLGLSGGGAADAARLPRHRRRHRAAVLAPAGNQGRRRVRRLPLPARHLGAVGGGGLQALLRRRSWLAAAWAYPAADHRSMSWPPPTTTLLDAATAPRRPRPRLRHRRCAARAGAACSAGWQPPGRQAVSLALWPVPPSCWTPKAHPLGHPRSSTRRPGQRAAAGTGRLAASVIRSAPGRHARRRSPVIGGGGSRLSCPPAHRGPERSVNDLPRREDRAARGRPGRERPVTARSGGDG